jgi:hypothetical protein
VDDMQDEHPTADDARTPCQDVGNDLGEDQGNNNHVEDILDEDVVSRSTTTGGDQNSNKF